MTLTYRSTRASVTSLWVLTAAGRGFVVCAYGTARSAKDGPAWPRIVFAFASAILLSTRVAALGRGGHHARVLKGCFFPKRRWRMSIGLHGRLLTGSMTVGAQMTRASGGLRAFRS